MTEDCTLKRLKVGYAETDITPTIPIETIGFNRKDNVSRGILKPLLAQVTVWEAEELCCLITIDSIGFKKELCDEVRNIVGKALGVSNDKVMICFSHCHSAPNADTAPKYFQLVCKKIEAAVKEAVIQMQEVSVGWGNAHVDIGVNRRKESKKLDPRAGILKVCDVKSNAMKLLIIRLTAHCNALKRDNYMISPDFFGDIRETLQNEYNCPVMIIQGAAGNIAPKYFKSQEIPVDAMGEQYIKSETALEDIAREVFLQTAPLIKKIKVNERHDIRMYSRSTVLYAQVPAYDTAQKIAQEAEENCGIDGREWIEEIKRLNSGGVEQQEEYVEIQYFKIGQWCLCGVPYELMVEFAIRSMEAVNNEFFYMNGYTNGCLSYFPTEEEFDKGGYEVYWSMLLYYSYYNRVFPLKRESAAELVEFTVANA